ncbi:unnamed protein product [Arabis nemorensis]|uniref:Uncharacterized protein n=1 Tax=Arabis nemorensis TaxID=586526 RepID=A0A565BWD2_9BRAS|nr:unnamed protein product [Arabis nemorensis]
MFVEAEAWNLLDPSVSCFVIAYCASMQHFHAVCSPCVMVDLEHQVLARFGLSALFSLAHESRNIRYSIYEKNVGFATSVPAGYTTLAVARTLLLGISRSCLIPIASLRYFTAVCRLSYGLSLTITLVSLEMERRALFIVFAPFNLGIWDTYCSIYSFMEVVYIQSFPPLVSDCIVGKTDVGVCLAICFSNP